MKFGWLHDQKNNQKWTWLSQYDSPGLHWYLTDAPVKQASGVPGSLGTNYEQALRSACTILTTAGVAKHFTDVMPPSSARAAWTTQAIKTLHGCEAVLLDPDTGIGIVARPSKNHALVEEVCQFAQAFPAVAVFQHRGRRQLAAEKQAVCSALVVCRKNIKFTPVVNDAYLVILT